MVLQRVEFKVGPIVSTRPVRDGGEGVSLGHRYSVKEDWLGYIMSGLISLGAV